MCKWEAMGKHACSPCKQGLQDSVLFSLPAGTRNGIQTGRFGASADLLNHVTGPTFKFTKEGPVLQRLYSLLGQSQMATMVVNLFLQHAFTFHSLI